MNINKESLVVHKKVSHAQLKMLLELLSEDGVLIDGRVDTRNVTHVAFWKAIASRLNAVEGGSQKPALKWSKVWSDWKVKTKKKVQKLIEKKPHATIESLAVKDLSKLEVKLLKLINHSNENIAKPTPTEELVYIKFEPQDTESGNVTEFEEVQVDNIVKDNQLDSNVGTSHEDNDNEFNFDVKSHESDLETNIKKDTSILNKMHRRIMPNRQAIYQSKTRLFIEKERILLRREELRLKALELKLKSEQLRLQEKEMTKVNSLMNIEEEKLKCIKEISASLKEFLERSNGSNTYLLNNEIIGAS